MFSYTVLIILILFCFIKQLTVTQEKGFGFQRTWKVKLSIIGKNIISGSHDQRKRKGLSGNINSEKH
jgi:hypothetical protein